MHAFPPHVPNRPLLPPEGRLRDYVGDRSAMGAAGGPVIGLVRQRFCPDGLAFGLVQPGGLALLDAHGKTLLVLAREDSFVQYLLASDGVVTCPDLADEDAWQAHPVLVEHLPMRAIAAAPLRHPSGDAVGLLLITFTEPRVFSDAECAELDMLAALAMQQLEQDALSWRNRSLEAQLRQARQSHEDHASLLADMADVAKIGGWALDLTTDTLTWTEQTRQIHGVDADYQPTVASAISFYAPEARPVLTEAIETALETGSPWDLTLPFHRTNGERIWVRAMGRAVLQEETPVRLIGTFQDVSEQVARESRLERSRLDMCQSLQDEKLLVELQAAALADTSLGAYLKSSIETISRHLDAWCDRAKEAIAVGVTLAESFASKRDLAIEMGARQLGGDHQHQTPLDVDGETVGWLAISGVGPSVSKEMVGDLLERIGGVLKLGLARRTSLADLAQERAWLSTIFEATEVIPFEWRLDRDCLVVSERWHRLANDQGTATHLSPSELMNRIHPDDRKRVEEALENHLLGQTAKFRCDCRLVRDGGEIIHIAALGQARDRDESGRPTRLVGTLIDVSVRVRARQELDRQRSQLIRVMEGTGAGAWEYDVCNDIVSVNRRWAEIHGLPDNKLTLTFGDIRALSHPDDSPAARAAYEAHVSGKTPTFFARLRRRHTDGSWRWIEDRGGVVERDGEGRPSRIAGINIDVTEKVEAEEALQEATRELSTFFDLALDGLIIFDTTGIVIKANGALSAMLGYERDEFNGQSMHHLLHPEDVSMTYDALHALQRGETLVQFVNRYRHVDGSYRSIEWHARPSGNRIFAAARDVTEREAYEQELMDQRSAAEAANVAKSQFLATMSHEIRTPMNGVLGMIDHVLRGDLTDDQRTSLGVAHRSATQLLDVLNDILSFSKLEAGEVTMREDPFVVDEAIRISMRLFAPIAAEKGLTLSSQIDTLPLLLGDSGRLHQVVSNLVTNAVKFTEEGEVVVHARQEEGEDGPRLRISVSDTGIGIAPEALGRIFDKFVQVDGSHKRQYAGTGLGLAISRQLVRLMGGDILVESEPGVGSTFTIDIPLRSAPEISSLPDAASQPAHMQQVDKDLASATRRLRILGAEDNATNQIVLRTLIDALGHHLTVVENGADAIVALETQEFDLVLMDIQMPVMDGLSATKAIRARTDHLAHIPIIALTANAMPEDRDRYLAAGMNGYVAKPIQPSALCAALDQALQDRSDAVDSVGSAA